MHERKRRASVRVAGEQPVLRQPLRPFHELRAKRRLGVVLVMQMDFRLPAGLPAQGGHVFHHLPIILLHRVEKGMARSTPGAVAEIRNGSGIKVAPAAHAFQRSRTVRLVEGLKVICHRHKHAAHRPGGARRLAKVGKQPSIKCAHGSVKREEGSGRQARAATGE